MIQFFRNYFWTDFLCLNCLRFFEIFLLNMNRIQYVVVTLSVCLFVVSAVPLGILPDVQNAAPSPGMYASTLFYGETPFILIKLNAFVLLFHPQTFLCENWNFLITQNDYKKTNFEQPFVSNNKNKPLIGSFGGRVSFDIFQIKLISASGFFFLN